MTQNVINVASFIPQTQTLGPGKRAALWVQGCPFRCPACIVPEWQLDLPNQLVEVSQVAGWILSTPAIEGLTISGGEPIFQAKALVDLIRQVKKHRPLNIISFTGYTLKQLFNRMKLYPEIGEFFDLIDVLIDGPYVKELDDDRGLRGSSNQKVHFLTEVLSRYDFENGPREVEFHIEQNDILLAGIPPHGLMDLFSGVVNHLNPGPASLFINDVPENLAQEK